MQFTAFHRFISIVGDQFGEAHDPSPEDQRGEYESGTARLGGHLWRVRTASVTPTKPGAFVAAWRRDERGETRPFGSDDGTEGLLVFVHDGERFGVFRFTASHLQALGVTASAAHPGKRGFRVYPSWCEDLNAQATRTQRAQAPAFSLLA
ncbi:hypothetical protein JOF28_001146 [Leucobacter exalbidus]|uniref:Metallopeptidase n=1 Tax=Leucobacter exalbidus TaxID=662960 RepID=A0A940PV84_9MICO|nr:hypothetical protein [Leucobacter exalbidus]